MAFSSAEHPNVNLSLASNFCVETLRPPQLPLNIVFQAGEGQFGRRMPSTVLPKFGSCFRSVVPCCVRAGGEEATAGTSGKGVSLLFWAAQTWMNNQTHISCMTC